MKILIACNKYSYKYIGRIKKQLELMGHEIILPNYFDDPMIEEKIKKELSKEEHIKFYRESFLKSQQKTKDSDILLVLNFDKVKYNKIYKNYIGGATFLEIYDSYVLGHNIYIYNDVPEGVMYDEIEGMDVKVINGNLFKLDENYKKYEKNHLLNYFSKSFLEKLESYDIYEKALIIIKEVFKNKKDKAGYPYIGHLYRVSNKLETKLEKVAGLLHDIVEDTDITFYDLLEVEFPLEVVEIVSLVTKKKIDRTNLSKDEKLRFYNDEIDGIIKSGNRGAINLKEADMSDNFDEDRLKELPKEKQEWFKEKYEKQLIKLRKVKGNDKK